jgi:ABC-type antimicrobial peptide transport system permease subunit
MEEAVAASYQNTRITLWLVGAFAAGALILAGVGTYGVIAFQTGTRAREFGIRMAVGAGSAQVAGMVLTQLAGTLAWAVPLGVGLSLAAGRLTINLLYGVAPTDLRVPLAAALFLIAIAGLSSLGPALQAASGRSLRALRAE